MRNGSDLAGDVIITFSIDWHTLLNEMNSNNEHVLFKSVKSFDSKQRKETDT